MAAVLTLLGAGYGVRRGRHDGGDQLPTQFTTLTQQQSDTAAKMAEVVTTLDRIVTTDLERIEQRAERPGRDHCRLAGDGDALDIIVTHLGEELPEQARRSIGAKPKMRWCVLTRSTATSSSRRVATRPLASILGAQYHQVMETKPLTKR